MSLIINSNLIPLFRGLVTGLQPFADAQDVNWYFESSIDSLSANYNPENILSEITVLLSRVISFTPQTYKVKVSIESCKKDRNFLLVIGNSGVNLSRVGEILASVKNGLKVESLEKGTKFIVNLPTEYPASTQVPDSEGELLPKKYPMYFRAVHHRLSTHFSKSENLEKLAEGKSHGEGGFLKKVNAVIQAHISEQDFKVDTLANAMALSRTQLFRKIKALTHMSPQRYLRFVRLEKAKKLLQAKDKDLNVSEVCYEVGFTSKSHFTRSFQKEFGFNPSEFIKGKM